jgi:hypothetical protein
MQIIQIFLYDNNLFNMGIKDALQMATLFTNHWLKLLDLNIQTYIIASVVTLTLGS